MSLKKIQELQPHINWSNNYSECEKDYFQKFNISLISVLVNASLFLNTPHNL